MKIKNTSDYKINPTFQPRNKYAKLVLQTFVWILIIAFISTIGVSFNMQAVPVIVKSKYTTVDLTGNSIFMIEKNELDRQIQEKNPNMDPRFYQNYLNEQSLTNTMLDVARQDLFNEINLKPSSLVLREFQNSSLPSSFLSLQYGLQSFFGPSGILQTIATPTIADIYAFRDLQEFKIATEIVALNKTNFLISKVTGEELMQYFDENVIDWAEKANVTEFLFENRAEARKGAAIIAEKGLKEAINEFSQNKKVSINQNVIVTADPKTYTYFIELLKAYKNNTNAIAISAPLYAESKYKIAVFNEDINYTLASPQVRFDILKSYVTDNYDMLSKNFAKEWNDTVQLFETKIKENESFTTIASEIPSVFHRVSSPFTVLQDRIYSVEGVELSMPILKDKELLKAILDTPINSNTAVINTSKSKEWYFSFKPLLKEFRENTEIPQLTPQAQQELTSYKSIKMSQMFGEKLYRRYNVKDYPEALTNLTLQ